MLERGELPVKKKGKRKPRIDWKAINCWGPAPTVRETLK